MHTEYKHTVHFAERVRHIAAASSVNSSKPDGRPQETPKSRRLHCRRRPRWVAFARFIELKSARTPYAYPYGRRTGKSEAEQVEGFMARITDGVLPEDRQDAVAGLRDLLVHNSEAGTTPPN